jgi:hypothetical protein
MTAKVEFRAKCTTCQKVETLTEEQVREAQQMGCAFSACCQAVATIEAVTVRRLRDGAIKVSSRGVRGL